MSSTPHFTFRRLATEDLPMLHEWLNRPHITAWWGGQISWERVEKEFQDHIHSSTVFGYIALKHGVPTAYVQAYEAAAVGGGWWPDASAGTWGIDQSLANEIDLGKGIGT